MLNLLICALSGSVNQIAFSKGELLFRMRQNSFVCLHKFESKLPFDALIFFPLIFFIKTISSIKVSHNCCQLRVTNYLTEVVAQTCSIKKVFLDISQNSEQNTFAFL